MADSDESQHRSTQNTIPAISRLVSATHLDDCSQYHGRTNDEDNGAYIEDRSNGSDLTKEKSSETTDIEESIRDAMPETGNEFENEMNKDVESGLKLEKTKSARSMRDPNLVSVCNFSLCSPF